MKIKLTSAKTTNGTSTPKAAKKDAVTPKSTKAKPKKSAAKAKDESDEGTPKPKEPEQTPEEKREKKEACFHDGNFFFQQLMNYREKSCSYATSSRKVF